jgi:hypothetical protein
VDKDPPQGGSFEQLGLDRPKMLYSQPFSPLPENPKSVASQFLLKVTVGYPLRLLLSTL